MKIVVRIFFALVFCFMVFISLKSSNFMIQERPVVKKHMVRGLKGRFDSILEEAGNRSDYIKNQRIEKQVNQKIEEMQTIIEKYSSRHYMRKVDLGVILITIFCFVTAFSYLMVVGGMLLSRFRNIKFAWVALGGHVCLYVIVFIEALIPIFILSKWSSLTISLMRLIDPAFNSKIFTMADAVKIVFLAWPAHLTFLIYMVVCTLFFKSSFYQDKEKVV